MINEEKNTVMLLIHLEDKIFIKMSIDGSNYIEREEERKFMGNIFKQY